MLSIKKESITELLPLLDRIASTSSDPQRHVAAIALNAEGQVLMGRSNHHPKGCVMTADRLVRPEKYFWIEHAERNLIYAAARESVSLVGATILVSHVPCMDCARALALSGARTVIAVKPSSARWQEHCDRAQTLFHECEVAFSMYADMPDTDDPSE